MLLLILLYNYYPSFGDSICRFVLDTSYRFYLPSLLSSLINSNIVTGFEGHEVDTQALSIPF